MSKKLHDCVRYQAILRSWDVLGVQRTERERTAACYKIADALPAITAADASLIYTRLSSLDRSVGFRMSSKEFSEWYMRNVVSQVSDEGKHPAASLDKVLEKYRTVVFHEFACTLWLFTHLLILRLLRDGVRDVFFLAREGQPLKKIFDVIASRRSLDTVIRSHYFVASRKATYLMSLGNSHAETFDSLRTQYPHISPCEFLESLGFEAHDILLILRDAGVEFPFTRLPFFTSRAFEAITHCDRFHDIFRRRQVATRAAFNAYLAGFGVRYDKAGLAFVDVGWKGSIQDNIFKALGGDTEVTGYYCGLTEHRVISDRNKKIAILFDVAQDSPFCRVYNEFRPLFEIMLAASHGGAVGYGLNSDGQACPVLFWENKEQALYENSIRRVQEKLLVMIQELESLRLDLRLEPSVLRRLVALRHSRVVYRPTGREITFYQSLSHHENFGINQFADHKLGVRPSLRSRVQHLGRLLREPRQQLLRHIWPALSLRIDGLDFLRLGYGIAKSVYCFSIPLRVLCRRLLRNRDASAIEAQRRYVRSQEDAIEAQGMLIQEREVYLKQLKERLTANGFAKTG
jgi:hypothetical protein